MRRQALLASALGLALLAHSATAQTIENPELFGKSVAAAQQALEHFGTWDDDEALRRVADIGYRLAGHSGYTKTPFTFFLVEMREPNAFALPGGQVFVTRGMLELGLTDDQLAGLLGHEIAHVTLQHGIKMQRRATLLNVLSQAVLVGVILAEGQSEGRPANLPYGRNPGGSYGSSSGQRIQGAAAAGMILGELLLRSYSREFEDQADEEGQRMAAAAGYAPVGAADLFALMESRLPQSRQYGYWRTHPFFTDRVSAARARGEMIKRQEPRPVDRYRAGTQAVLLDFDPAEAAGEETVAIELLLERAALVAWPQGETAERLRLQALHRLRDEYLAAAPLSRDYGALLRQYAAERGVVASLTPESPFLDTLDAEAAALQREVDERFPEALRTLDSGIYQTRFLETFLSNYPDAPQVPQAAYALALAYARMGRQTEAVERYLQAWRAEPQGALGQQALAGLRRLAPTVDQLAALEQLADQVEDEELRQLTRERLGQLAGSYADLANGAEYLRRFPEGSHADRVAQRLDQLAEKLLGEVILYQGVGESIKALERIQMILTHAPLSAAADRLRDRAVLEG
ncbi:MAG TPA: M48 family metalloprotease [Thermoanaerobaculia bacterium]|nr:M48 family metalloprotease [Thermoanaerobaculia bacterium]